MTDTSGIPSVVSELEGAGLMGLTAIALLVPFLRGGPGAIASTSTGFVWTKEGLSGLEGETASLGSLGKLRLGGGAVTVTLSVSWYGSRPEIDILFQLNDAQALSLEVSQSLVAVAEKITAPGEDGALIGFNTNKNQMKPLVIQLPAVALEFSFRPGLGDGVAASFQTYQSLDFTSSPGIFEWRPDPDKLLVFRKFFDVGISVEKLFLDLSNTNGVADFKSRFSDVYKASWMGFGAQQIDLVVPVSDYFIIGSAEGFLVDCDGQFTGDFSIAWQRPQGDTTLKSVEAEVSLRENNFRRGELSFTVDLNGASEETSKVAGAAETPPAGTVPEEERGRAETAKTEFELRKADLDFDGHVKFTGGFFYGYLDEDDKRDNAVCGFDLTAASVFDGQGNAIGSLEGGAARGVLWSLGVAYGLYLLVKGLDQSDLDKSLVGGLLLLLIAYDHADNFGEPENTEDSEGEQGSSSTVMPRLTKLTLNKILFRYAHIPTEKTIGSTPDQEVVSYSQHLVEIGVDASLIYNMNCGLVSFIEGLATFGLSSGDLAADFLGGVINRAKLKGNLELEFGNLFLRYLYTEEHEEGGVLVEGSHDLFADTDDRLRRLLEERSPVIVAKQIPEIEVSREAGDDSLALPVVTTKAVRVGSGQELKRGISISISGLGNSSMAIGTPSAGIVVFWSPEVSVEPQAQLRKDPGFTFIMPPTCYAYGVIDLNKPLPSIGGSQSRIAVDVGINNTEVPAGKKLTASDQRKLRDFKNYKYAFGGELVWGDATGPNGEDFSYLFTEIHYEGKSPIFTLGPVAVYGLGGLFGHNIAPGVAKEQQNAVGIADWISGDEESSFESVKNWPKDGPGAGTWHPDRDWEEDKDKWALGLFIKAGSAGDSGKSVMADTIVMMGFPECWLAVAGNAIIKPINATLAVVIVYDAPSGSFLIRATFKYKIDKENGRIIDMKTKLEVGSTRDPKRGWFHLGHYGNDKGGPAGAKLFSLFNTDFYVVYDTEGTDSFGLVPNESIDLPGLPGPLFGFGALLQFGPKTYGPSWLNLSIFAGIGFNVAVGSNPFIIYGDLYALGHVQLKVAVLKAKLSLAARLYGLCSDPFHRFAGEFEVRIGLPWPFDDISESCSFVIEKGVPPFDAGAEITSTASALGRLSARSLDITPAQQELVPIDSIIAIAFNKPIFEVEAASDVSTMLTINDPQVPDDAPEPVEILTTTFDDRSYEITLTHVLRFMRIERRPILDDIFADLDIDIDLPPGEGGGPGPIQPSDDERWVLVSEVAAAWEPPGDYGEDGAPGTSNEPHHVLYLNTFAAPELQFSRSALEQYFEWTRGWGTVPPCSVTTSVCLLSPGSVDAWDGPDVDQSGKKWSLRFKTPLGGVDIEEQLFLEDSFGGRPVNLNRLAWNRGELDLPRRTALWFPAADSVDMTLRIGSAVFDDPRFLLALSCELAVQLRGAGTTTRLRLRAVADPGQDCGFLLEIDTREHDADRLDFTVDVKRCEPGTEELVLDIKLVASEFETLIGGVILEGPLFDWDYERLDEIDTAARLEIYGKAQSSLIFRLEQTCFERSGTAQSHWGESCLAGCDDRPELGVGVDALWSNLLLEPNSEYRISYGVTSFAKSQVKSDEQDEPNESTEADPFDRESSEEHDSKLRSFRFRTETAPSQEPERYIGLTYPNVRDGSGTPYYPDHFSPFLSLKNAGLLRRIYQRHYGEEMLAADIFDIDGNAIDRNLVQTVRIGSSPLDEALNDVVGTCLPNDAQSYTWLELQTWQPQLATDRDYSLQLTDLRPGATAPLMVRSFRTSRFASFAEHSAHVESLFAEAHVIPVLDPAGVPQALSALCLAVMEGRAPGNDALVEAIYRTVLGIDGGSLRQHLGQPAGDLAGYLVGHDSSGGAAWGMVLELDEPLLGKEGLSLLGRVAAGAEALVGKGLSLIEESGRRRLLIHDSAGTRVIVLNSADAVTFMPFQVPVVISLRYAPGDGLAAAAQRYLEATLPPLDEASFDRRLADLMAVLEADPGLQVMLEVHHHRLKIPLPLLETEPPPDTGGGGSDGPVLDPRPDPDDPKDPGGDPRDPPDPGPRPGPQPDPRPKPRSLGDGGSTLGSSATKPGSTKPKVGGTTTIRPLKRGKEETT